MAKKVKVSGYAQRTFYDDGIEYRNFSDNLVGNQITSPDAVFTSGNFSVQTNFDEKIDKNFNTNKFSSFISLDDLKVSQEGSENIQKKFNEVKLNLDKSKLDYYAYFGSLVEFIRVSLENIIVEWPASLYVEPYNNDNPSITGYTSENYNYNITKNHSTFEVGTSLILNKFDINYRKDGSLINTYNETNDNRNLTDNYTKYVISPDNTDKTYPIIGFSGSTDNNNKLKFKVKGDVFSGQTNTKTKYHVKPKNPLLEEFHTKLSDFESNLLNRDTIPKYKSSFDYKAETETGLIINTSKSLIWPVSDGYNIDFDTTQYVEFVKNLIEIGEQSDKTKSNIIIRDIVADSISDFDTTPKCDGKDEETDGQKMNSTLKIYGREFDEVKKHIDGIKLANTVTYNKKDNTPDLYLKNLARVLGWDVMSSVLENDLLKTFLTPKKTTYDGRTKGYTPHEAEVELWRRLILNTPWIWKSKGTRKAVDFFLKFIGTPTGLIKFNEYIYRAKKPINMGVFNDILYEKYGKRDISGLKVDREGFPKLEEDTPDMYFQKGGLWYRETAGPNSNNDISKGNNPHIGPYDRGAEYINQFKNLIPDFEPTLIREEYIEKSDINLFTNYNNGTVNNILKDDVYVDAVNHDNIPVDCYDVVGEVIPNPKPQGDLTDCGCEIGDTDESIKISISKVDSQPEETNDCGYTGFSLNPEGYVVFNLPSGENTTDINKGCCESLNFKYESNSPTPCKWKEEVVAEPPENNEPPEENNDPVVDKPIVIKDDPPKDDPPSKRDDSSGTKLPRIGNGPSGGEEEEKDPTGQLIDNSSPSGKKKKTGLFDNDLINGL